MFKKSSTFMTSAFCICLKYVCWWVLSEYLFHNCLYYDSSWRSLDCDYVHLSLLWQFMEVSRLWLCPLSLLWQFMEVSRLWLCPFVLMSCANEFHIDFGSLQLCLLMSSLHFCLLHFCKKCLFLGLTRILIWFPEF